MIKENEFDFEKTHAFVGKYKMQQLFDKYFPDDESVIAVYADESRNPVQIISGNLGMLEIGKVIAAGVVTQNAKTSLCSMHIGIARRHPKDEYSSVEGILCAVRRAVTGGELEFGGKKFKAFRIEGFLRENLDDIKKCFNHYADTVISEFETIEKPSVYKAPMIHFVCNIATSVDEMNDYMQYMKPNEIVLCTADNSFYRYNAKHKKMTQMGRNFSSTWN